MASATAVYIKSGDQPRAFNWGNQVSPSTGATTTIASLPIYKESVYSAFQAIVAGTSGTQTATVVFEATNDDNTGRGFVLGGQNAPGCLVTTTSGSTSLTSPQRQFTSALVGATVSAPGVPVGTTVSSVTNAGTLVLSANATASATVQGNFFANYWMSTVLGTITLSGSVFATDGFTTVAPWRYVRARVTAISGTGATVTCTMGV